MKIKKRFLILLLMVFTVLTLIGCDDVITTITEDVTTIQADNVETTAIDETMTTDALTTNTNPTVIQTTPIIVTTEVVVTEPIETSEAVVKYTVEFENTDLASVEVVEGDKVQRPTDPILEGYVFDGWYTDFELTVLYDFNQVVDSDMTLYAKFMLLEVKHTVVFENTDIDSIQVLDGEKVVKPSDPIKAGFVFYNWYSDAGFTELYDFDQIVDENIIIYARFTTSLESALTVAAALEHDQSTSEKYYIFGEVKSISNVEYGNMVITDGVNDFTIYGVWSMDGTLKYEELSVRPVIGDTVLLYGVLSRYNENLEMTNSWLIALQKGEIPEFDLTGYTEGTIADAYKADVESKMVVEGVVARITYANGMSPNGLFLVDYTGSIYIYDYDIAASVNIGDTIKIAGTRKNFILETELNQAQILGYEGAIQLAEATLVSLVQTDIEFSKDGIEEVTIKDLLETDPTEENITGKIYKVHAFINEVAGTGFTNFYINDLDDLTGSYSYSMNNGNDFTWLRPYDGQIKTMYVAVINAKSTASGLIYRFVPILIEGDYTHDPAYNPIFAVKYYGIDQFIDEYSFSPDQELVTSISSEALGFSDVSLSYSSSNTETVYFENVEGKLIFKTGLAGSAVITISAADGDNIYSETVSVTVLEDTQTYDAISVSEAIALDDDTIVVVEGVVAASLVNKSGFYLIDETGVIAVEMVSSELENLSLGQLVVITGNKTHYGAKDDAVGQIAIREATILVNKYGDHDYSTASFINDKNLSDLIDLNKMEDHSTEVYIITATVSLKESYYYSLYSLKSGDDSINIYSSNAGQLSFLEPYIDQEVIVEFTVVNWNGKQYSGSIISITYNGVKIVNDSNF